MRGNPFDFVWPVDQEGYEIWRAPHDSETALALGRDETMFIRPRGGPLRYYRPLDCDGLWLRFGDSCKSADGVLSFANEFGLLLTQQIEFPDSPDEVSDFVSAAGLIREIAKRLDAGDRISAAQLLNEAGGAIVAELVLHNERTAAFERLLAPMTLLGALLHQAAEAISGNRRFRRCRNQECPNWFRVGPGARTARCEFCSDRCRVASARRKEGRRPEMRRTGHIRQRSPGSFELRYDLAADPATGRRKTVTTTVRGSRKDAERELRRLLHAVDTGQHVDPHRTTVREWLTTWLAVIRQQVAPRTAERYEEIVSNFIVPALGSLQVVRLTPSHIQGAHNQWAENGRRDGREGGLSAQTRRHIHRLLSSALARAVEQQLIARNPCDVFRKRLPKVEHREIATLTVEQSQRLLAAIRHTRVYWPTLIALATGMRRGEILALR